MLHSGIGVDIFVTIVIGIFFGLGFMGLFKLGANTNRNDSDSFEEFTKASKLAFKWFKICMYFSAFLILLKLIGFR